MQIFLISDTHWRHDNIYGFTHTFDGVVRRIRPQFDCAKDADEFMREQWNSLVKPGDHVWHLGDMTMARNAVQQDQFISFVRSLHGYKRLVLGNHDHFPMHVYASAGIQKVVGSHRHAGLIYTHWPVHPSSVATPKVLANVHGHIHAQQLPGKYINVCVEHTNYAPVPIDVVLEIARKKNEA
jgi:calcineurin-like phosphoesterase family protein